MNDTPELPPRIVFGYNGLNMTNESVQKPDLPQRMPNIPRKPSHLKFK